MAPYEDTIVWINGVKFIDVTHQTVTGKTYSYEEAHALTKNKFIITYETESTDQ